MVITHQIPGEPVIDVDELRRTLSGKANTVDEIPYDPHLGTGRAITASELAPGQWVDLALTRTVGMQGIWLLIYVSGLMFVMRHFAGALAHRFSATLGHCPSDDVARVESAAQAI